MSQTISHRITLEDHQECVQVFGEKDLNLKLIRDSFPVTLVARGNELLLSGEPLQVTHAAQVIERIRLALKNGHEGYLSTGAVHKFVAETKGESAEESQSAHETILVSSRKKPIAARSANQQKYVDSIRNHDIVFGVGPAGTGKTYLAMAMAVAALRESQVERLVLTRPAVEAGEKLGFLPGDLQEKVDPYLRPLYDALYDMVEYEKLQRLFQQRVVEVAPLAYMRGRTLSNAFIILDEAQNTSPEQMKMFLTRMGAGSKMVVTGDVTQIDLPTGKVSGLIEVRRILTGTEGIAFIDFEPKDVVRHRLVMNILRAYQTHDEAKEKQASPHDSKKP